MRQSAMKIVSRLRNGLLASALGGWVSWTEQQRGLRRVLARLSMAALCQAFEMWATAVVDASRAKAESTLVSELQQAQAEHATVITAESERFAAER
eukprot:COSAG04_NODE_17761_length_459_cov_1.572222_1_plen_95_part_01